MVFEQCVEKVCKIDKRNKFTNGKATCKNLPEFYKYYNPVDVEFKSNLGIIRMLPIDEISKETASYSYIKLDFVFALINGEPLFVKDKKVYICENGNQNPTLEKVAYSFEEFLKNII